MDLKMSGNLTHKPVETMPRILAVDNNEDNLVLMAHILRRLNCQLLTTTNGMEALSLARDYQPHLILLEMFLFEVNSIFLVRKLKQNYLTSEIPIVAVTGLALAEDKALFLAAGCDDYICKPYIIDEFEALLYRYLHQYLPTTLSRRKELITL